MKLIKNLGIKEFKGKRRQIGLFKCLKCGKEEIKRIDIPQKNDYCRTCNLTKHGLADKHKLYHVWLGMKGRCYNKNNPRYNTYGAKGIIVCDEWLDFKNFYDWSISNGYIETTNRNIKTTLDRINVNGNYEPSNCRFITNKEQMLNRHLLQSNNSSGYRGVSRKTKTKWVAQVQLNDGTKLYSPRNSDPKICAIWREEMITKYHLNLQRNKV